MVTVRFPSGLLPGLPKLGVFETFCLAGLQENNAKAALFLVCCHAASLPCYDGEILNSDPSKDWLPTSVVPPSS